MLSNISWYVVWLYKPTEMSEPKSIDTQPLSLLSQSTNKLLAVYSSQVIVYVLFGNFFYLQNYKVISGISQAVRGMIEAFIGYMLKDNVDWCPA